MQSKLTTGPQSSRLGRVARAYQLNYLLYGRDEAVAGAHDRVVKPYNSILPLIVKRVMAMTSIK